MITNTYQKLSGESNCKPNKVWVYKGNEFVNRSMKSFFQNKDIEIYSRKENLMLLKDSLEP